MRRLALGTVVTMLALPSVAGAATFPARVVRAGARVLTVRLADGSVVRYRAPRVAGAAAQPSLLAHAAREAAAGALVLDLHALDPGVTVLVTARAGSTAGAVISLPGPGSVSEEHATGVVSDVEGDGFTLELPDRTRLRLHTAARVRACQTAGVDYHQDAGVLVADRVHRGPGRAAHGCRTRSVAGTITAISSTAVTIGRRTFSASPAVTSGFNVGDRVDVSYTRGAGGSLVAQAIEYVQRVARGTVTAAGGGTLSIADGATGRALTFAASATAPAGAHVVIVYHRSRGGRVADVLYAARAS
jgi:hypothetical protein